MPLGIATVARSHLGRPPIAATSDTLATTARQARPSRPITAGSPCTPATSASAASNHQPDPSGEGTTAQSSPVRGKRDRNRAIWANSPVM